MQGGDTKTYITFGDKKTAERFVGLIYVKFKACYINRQSLSEVTLLPLLFVTYLLLNCYTPVSYKPFLQVKNMEKEAQKRKIEDDKEKVSDMMLKGSCVKLTGFNQEAGNKTHKTRSVL